MKTVVIQIGNSDNKLTQNEWAHFAAAVDIAISGHAHTIHFKGGSDWDAPWQNACWVCEVHEATIPALKVALRQDRINARQDSVAMLVGDTMLI